MRFALLTTFHSFADHYSLAHVVFDQAMALEAAGHEVQIWCLEDYEEHEKLTMLRTQPADVLPRQRYRADEPDEALANQNALAISRAIKQYQPDVVIAHDLMLQSHFINLAWACHMIGDTLPVKWFHYLHSGLQFREMPNEKSKWRRMLPDGHDIIYPLAGAEMWAVAYYGCEINRIHTCANVHDPRTVWKCDPDVVQAVTDLGLCQADFVQIMPACSSRLPRKGVATAGRIFKHLSRYGTVRLVVVNPNSLGHEDKIHDARDFAGLEEPELTFTSELRPDWCQEVPHRVVQQLMRFSNILIWPSQSEVLLAQYCRGSAQWHLLSGERKGGRPCEAHGAARQEGSVRCFECGHGLPRHRWGCHHLQQDRRGPGRHHRGSVRSRRLRFLHGSAG